MEIITSCETVFLLFRAFVRRRVGYLWRRRQCALGCRHRHTARCESVLVLASCVLFASHAQADAADADLSFFPVSQVPLINYARIQRVKTCGISVRCGLYGDWRFLLVRFGDRSHSCDNLDVRGSEISLIVTYIYKPYNRPRIFVCLFVCQTGYICTCLSVCTKYFLK